MSRQNVQIVLVAVVLIGVAGVAAGQSGELVRVIAMEPEGRFSLGNVSGQITVTGVDGDDLTIRATKRVAGRGSAAADALDRVEIDIEKRGSRVIVETDYPRRRRSFLQSLASLFSGGVREPFVAVDYLVTVPRGTAVAVESFDGDVTVDGGGRRDARENRQWRWAARFVSEAGGGRDVLRQSGDRRRAQRRRPDRRDRQRADRYREGPGTAAAGEVLRRRGGVASGRVPARPGGDGIGIGDLRRRARCRRPVRATRGEVLRRRGGAARSRVPGASRWRRCRDR